MTEKISLKTLFSPFRNFPITLSCIWLFTIFLIFNISVSSIFYQQIISELLTFLFSYGTVSFPTEALFLKKQRSKRYFLALIPGILLSLFFVWLEAHTFSLPYFDFFHYFVCFFLVFFFLGISFCFRSLSCPLEAYLVKVFDRAVRTHVIWLLLSMSLYIIMPIVLQLFHLDSFFLLQIFMLLFGLYYVPSFLLSWYPEKGEENVITCFLIKYILSGMLILIFSLLSVYLLKMWMGGSLSSSAPFRITAVFFLPGMLICLMNTHFQESNPFRRIMKWLPCLYLPFIPLQIYSIGIRIYEYGITPLRYGAVLYILFECTALFLYYFRFADIKYLPLLAAILVAFAGFFPYANMDYISYCSQRNAIERFLALSPEEQHDICNSGRRLRYDGAYQYLRSDYLGNEYLSSLTWQETEALSSLDQRE